MVQLLKKSAIKSLLLFNLLGWSYIFSQTHFGGGNPIFYSARSVIPFQTKGHKIYLKVKIAQYSKPLSFILDTGAFTSISDKTSRLLGLTQGSSLRPAGQISYAYFLNEPVTIQVGEMAVDQFRLVSMDYTHYYTTDPNFHGFLGSDFLKFFYVKIDYRRNELTLSRNALPISQSAQSFTLPLNTKNNAYLPRINCQVDRRWNWSGLIDTGAPFAIIFPMAALENQRRSRAPLIESDGLFASWPTSTIEKNYLSRVNTLSMGKLELQNLPVIFSNTEDIILGEEFLSHFEIFLHYPDEELILVQQTNLNWRNNFYSIGINLGKNSENRTIIEGIWQGSSAARAGIPLYSEVIKINQQLTNPLSLKEMNRILNNDRIHTIELVVRHRYHEKTYRLRKTPLLPEN